MIPFSLPLQPTSRPHDVPGEAVPSPDPQTPRHQSGAGNKVVHRTPSYHQSLNSLRQSPSDRKPGGSTEQYQQPVASSLANPGLGKWAGNASACDENLTPSLRRTAAGITPSGFATAGSLSRNHTPHRTYKTSTQYPKFPSFISVSHSERHSRERPDSACFPDSIDQALQHRKASDRWGPYLPLSKPHVRSASSLYNSDGEQSVIHHEPASPPLANRLSVSNLSDFASAEGMFASLSSADLSRGEVEEEAAAAISQWHGGSLDADTDGSSTKLASLTASGRQMDDEDAPSSNSIREMKNVYDGQQDTRRDISPEFARMPPHHSSKGVPSIPKRKTSHFTLKSMSTSLAKRPRVALGRIASNVFEEGRRLLGHVKREVKDRKDKNGKEFRA